MTRERRIGGGRPIVLIALALALVAGGAASQQAKPRGKAPVLISFDFHRTTTIASNQYAVWIEDEGGRYVRTLGATRFTAKGGYQSRPQALPEWVAASDWPAGKARELDAVSSATPRSGRVELAWDGRDSEGKPVGPGRYVYKVEATIFWETRVVWTGMFELGQGRENSTAEMRGYPDSESAFKRGLIVDNVRASVDSP